MIRLMTIDDKDEVLDMMKVFYNSPAVFTNGSIEIFQEDIKQCLSDNPYVEGYIFEDNEIQGYAMISKSYSTEFGKPCIWIEDLYIKEEHRGKGLGKEFFEYIQGRYQDVIFRLEVEDDNIMAVNLYKNQGFEILPYMEMKKG